MNFSEDDRDQVKEHVHVLTKSVREPGRRDGQGPRKRGHGELIVAVSVKVGFRLMSANHSRRHRRLRVLRQVHRPAAADKGRPSPRSPTRCRGQPFGAAVKAMPFDFDRPELWPSTCGACRSSTTPTGCDSTIALQARRRGAQHARALCGRAKAGVERWSTSASPTRPRIRRWSISAARPAGEGPQRVGHVPRHPSARGPLRQGGHPDQQHRLDLRRLPVFGVFGDGRYRLQPIYVDDLAALAVEQGASRRQRDHRRDRSGNVHLPRARGDHRPGDRQAASFLPCRPGSAMPMSRLGAGSSAT